MPLDYRLISGFVLGGEHSDAVFLVGVVAAVDVGGGVLSGFGVAGAAERLEAVFGRVGDGEGEDVKGGVAAGAGFGAGAGRFVSHGVSLDSR
jgi:hypothetical protein